MPDDAELAVAVREVLGRWPTAGLAVALVRDGRVWFHSHGVADVATQVPVDEDTVFRIASITKTFTAIAVMQLCEGGLVDLDAPADHYLRTFRLVPAFTMPARGRELRPVTLRHLLTHTAGVRAVRGVSDLTRPALGWGMSATGSMPDLAAYYRRGVRVDVEPGTRWAYSNHGFTVLGQIVADVSGLPLADYLRRYVFDPLGMERTDLVRSARLGPRLATGYELHRSGLRPAPDLDVITVGGGAAFSTARDLARYAAALLAGGGNEHGRVLRPDTLATMFAPQYQPDPRVPGMGLAFLRGNLGGHRTVGHDGIWRGFLSDLTLAPDDGVAAVALANTGQFEPRGAPTPTTQALLRHLLRVDDDHPAAPERPWLWGDLCGWYAFGPGVLLDPQPRMALGAGVEVVARGGHLIMRGQMPVPAVRRGLRLEPDAADPDVFRVDLTAIGAGPSRVVFSRDDDGQVVALHLTVMPMSFVRRPNARNPRLWAEGVLAAATVAGAATLARRES